MRSFHWYSLIACVLSFGAVGLGPAVASAAPCCSAPICQQEEPPSPCNYCHPLCFDDDATSLDDEIVYDEESGVCYADAAPVSRDGDDTVEVDSAVVAR